MDIDERMHADAERLSTKHGVSFEDALEVLCFFNGFLLHNYYAHAEMAIMSANRWHISPVDLINQGLHNATRNIHLS